MAIFLLPFTNTHELNLDWILEAIKSQETRLRDFVALNTIKYADPFQWDITSQYAQNTLVMDPQTGTAYLSTRPVPAGVQLTNTEYWTPVFTLQNFLEPLKKAITLPQETIGAGASTDIPAKTVFWAGEQLVYAPNDIPVGTIIIPGTNCLPVTVVDLINEVGEVQETVTQQGQTIQQLGQTIQQQGQTIQQQGQAIQEETQNREQADAQLRQEILTAGKYKTIVDYGAVEGGTQDCSAAIMAQIAAEGVARIPVGLFLVSKQITMRNCSIIGAYADLSYGYDVTANNSSTLILSQTAVIDSFTANSVVFVPNTTGTKSGKAFAAPTGQRACSALFTKCRFDHWQYVVSNIGSFSCQQCTFANCDYALQNIEDSRITACLFAANRWPIYLSDGWGADIIEGCKIEWNGSETDGGGIACSGTLQVTITGNIIDRCGPTGLSIYNSQHITCTGNVILRSYTQNELYSSSDYVTACNTNYKKDWLSDTEQNKLVPNIGVRANLCDNSYIISASDCTTPFSEDNKGNSTTFIVNGKAVSQP